MTSRDHLLGHAPAAQYDDDPLDLDWQDWMGCSLYPLGIPERALPKQPPIVAKPAMLPMLDRCTPSDHAAIQGWRLKAALAGFAIEISALRGRHLIVCGTGVEHDDS